MFTLLFQGCGSSNKSTPTKIYPTAIGEAISITNDEKNSVMAPSPHLLEEIANNIANILKAHIVEINQQEAINFTKEINYCDISGEKESSSTETLKKFITMTHYKTCKSQKSNQHGTIELTSELTDSDGKYPKTLKLLVKKAYTFNDMVLQRDLMVESKILYHENKSLNKISLKMNGIVNFKYQTLKFENFEQDSIF